LQAPDEPGLGEYRDPAVVLEHVIGAFSKHADPATCLLIRQTAYERGRHDYASLISDLGERYGSSHRLAYVYDLPLPKLIRHAIAVITVNSAIGLSALRKGTAVKVLGSAPYDMPGLTSQRSLDRFF